MRKKKKLCGHFRRQKKKQNKKKKKNLTRENLGHGLRNLNSTEQRYKRPILSRKEYTRRNKIVNADYVVIEMKRPVT